MIRGSSKHQDRVLTGIGLAILLCIVLVSYLVIANPLGGRSADQFSVAFNTPYLGQGVDTGTAVVLHGVKVGQVSAITLVADGGVRVIADLQKRPTQGLTDALNIDFRTINYFGVPGINLEPRPGGQVLRNGSEITVTPTGNSTLSELLSQLGDVSAAALTPQLIEVMDRVTRYTDGLNPLFETAITVTQAIADVQTVSTEQLLSNTAAITVAFPGFNDAAIESARRIADFSYYPGQTFPPAATIAPRFVPPFAEGLTIPNLNTVGEQDWQDIYLKFGELVSVGVFAAVGKLLGSHVDDLVPLISGITALTDATPPLLRPAEIAQKLAELRSRFETLYAGNGEQRAISIRVVLDGLPAVAAPLGILTEGPK